MTKDFNVKVTVRNGHLLSAIMEQYSSAAEFARAINISANRLNAVICFRQSPINPISDDWADIARDIAAALGKYPDELWPDSVKYLRAKKASAEIEMDANEVRSLANPQSSPDAKILLNKWTQGLNDRHIKAVSMSIHGCTLEAIGNELNVGKERARQIQLKAFRHMRRLAKRDGVESITDVL